MAGGTQDTQKEPTRHRESLSVILPAFNEGDVIEKMVTTTEEYLSSRFDDFEIIVVDDGSTDDTAEITRKLTNKMDSVVLEVHEENSGKAEAFRTGFQLAQHELVLLLDADLELDPEFLDSFLTIRDRNDAEVVVGSKMHPESEIDYTISRTILSRGYALLVQSLFALEIGDPQTGMKLFEREVLEECLPKMDVKGLAFSVELLIIAQQRGYTISEAPISLDYKGNTSMSISTIFDMLRDTVRMVMQLRFGESS